MAAMASLAAPGHRRARRAAGWPGGVTLAALGLVSVAGLGAAAGVLTSAAGCSESMPGTGQSSDGGGTMTGGDMAGGGGGDMASDPEAQRPLQLDDTSIDSWLKTGKYKSWRCETAPVGNRSQAHSRTSRVCSNEPLYKTTVPPYPTDSTSVLELYNTSSQIIGYAVSIRTADGDGGQNRYWYESLSGNVSDGQGLAVCTSCHIKATSDYTYLRAP